uniref:Uncharacterized protein n=1 Tax=Podarcis muralis TaxID=64176 RepID=A0A670IG66_PODMU
NLKPLVQVLASRAGENMLALSSMWQPFRYLKLWAMLDPDQGALYKGIIMENYGGSCGCQTLGFPAKPWVPNAQCSDEMQTPGPRSAKKGERALPSPLSVKSSRAIASSPRP